MTERCMWGVWGGDKLICCPLQAATEQRKLLDNLLHTPLVALLPDVKTKLTCLSDKSKFLNRLSINISSWKLETIKTSVALIMCILWRLIS